MTLHHSLPGNIGLKVPPVVDDGGAVDEGAEEEDDDDGVDVVAADGCDGAHGLGKGAVLVVP